MNPIFKNVLAMTLLLSASVALKASDDLVNLSIVPSVEGVTLNILPNSKLSVRQLRMLEPKHMLQSKQLAAPVETATYANKLASALAQAKAFGAYVFSKPQATEGARLGGYLTLDNAKNVGTKFAVAAAAGYGLYKLYTYATSKSETNNKLKVYYTK